MSQIEHQGLVIPSSPADRKRLAGSMNELVVSMTRAKSEQDHKKNIVATIFEEFEIPKKLITKAASAMFNDTFQKVAAENEDFETFMDVLKLENEKGGSSQTKED